MKTTLHTIAASLLLAITCSFPAHSETIRISTDKTDLILKTANGNRLYQAYLGKRLDDDCELKYFPWKSFAFTDGLNVCRGGEAYSTAGNEDYFEPALGVIHNDGNQTTYLYYQGYEQKSFNGGTETVIKLADDQYPISVTLHYKAYARENIITCWTEICHNEIKPVTLSQYASSMIYFKRPAYHLTSFSSDWGQEAKMNHEQLQFGKKILDSKQGTRAAQFVHPFFEMGLGSPVSENEGEVLLGSIGWNGNFRFTFEVDNHGVLRIISGINPFASAYKLAPGTVFRTPDFYFCLSQDGAGPASRDFQRWARDYQIKDGNGDRFTLLNNWENTFFDFDQNKLGGIMEEGARLGVDLFLLDDGWFGNGDNARNGDNAGLGDWEVNHDKLPGGVPALVSSAKEAGVKFGIWIEPEMVNPKSKLYRKHPDWAIEQPDRKSYYFRNQLVLDITNPKVQDYVFGVVDNLMTENPDLCFFKWDCNSSITNMYSPYLKENQSQMYVDHVRGVYKVMERVSEKYPDLHMMMCSGGGGRCDYESLKHFTEFWLSDNTDPVSRCYIQWGFSQFFPAKAMCAHVTSMNRSASVKFRVDVASMCKLGFDIGLKDLTESEIKYCQTAISNWNRLKPVILEGDQYRLVSPYESTHMCVNYVNADKSQSVLFVYDIHPLCSEAPCPVKLQGLDPSMVYTMKEINLEDGNKSQFRFDGRKFSGEYLMNVGLDLLSIQHMCSHVIEFVSE